MTDQNILRQDPGRETESAAYCGRTRATLPADAPISLLPSLTQLRNTTDTACQLSHFTEGRLEADRRALPVFVLMESKIKAGRANVHHPGGGPRGKLPRLPSSSLYAAAYDRWRGLSAAPYLLCSLVICKMFQISAVCYTDFS